MSCYRFALIIASTLICRTVLASPPTNAVINPGFEDGLTGWTLQSTGATASGTIDEAVSHTGQRSLRLSNASAFQANIYYRAFQRFIPQPFTTYQISCWVKGQDSGDGFIGGGPGWTIRKEFPQGTFDWQKVSINWTSGANPEEFELLLLTQSPTKACWIDDVQVVAVGRDEAKFAEAAQAFNGKQAAQHNHLFRVSALAQRLGQADNPYVRLGVSIAERFLGRIAAQGLDQPMSWANLQLEEIDAVLNETERWMHGGAENLPDMRRAVVANAVGIHNGVFQEQGNPTYFGGYGAFGTVIDDLPSMPDFGVSVVQDGRQGPSSLDEQGRFSNDKSLVANFKTAQRNGVRIDLLLSPHYFPAWAIGQAPDLPNGNIGFIGFNIDHPKSRQVIEQWLRAVVPVVKDQPALVSYCLSNEPAYVKSGADPYSRPKWMNYLRNTHGTIQTLNALYGTNYTRFEDVPVAAGSAMPSSSNAQRAYYDWCRFNQINFAEWHHWMNDLIKSIDPHARTHIKPISNHTFNRGLVHIGVDPELFCEFTDIAGCDNYIGGEAALTTWPGTDLYYDLFNSFRNQPVFNSETHLIPDNFPPLHIRMENTRAVVWQAFLHHLGASTIWVWEKPTDVSLGGSIYLRPANIFGASRAMLDAKRLAKELTAINQAEPRIALLYSPPSIFWEKDYPNAIAQVYQQLRLSGEKVTFVSERQLAAGRGAHVQVIVSPRATHVADSTVQGLLQFVSHGGKLVLCGGDDLGYDEYHQNRKLPAELQSSPRFKISGDLRAALKTIGFELPLLENAAKHTSVTDVEYRFVNFDGGTLIPLINFSGTPMKVRLPQTVQGMATDLVSGRRVDRDAVELPPMVPLLLRCMRPN